MSHLIPEKRMDRNGRLVTKHVRNGPRKTSPHPDFPAPGVADAPKPGKPFKPRPRQLEQNPISMRLSNHTSDDPLTTDIERSKNLSQSAHTNFTASDVEFYDVFSVTSSIGNTLELMRMGIRSADDARSHLHSIEADHLIHDGSEVGHEALKRGINVHDFAGAYESLSPTERESPYLLDAVEFMNTSLNDGANRYIKDEIINGNVSYSDIKAIGITKLKSRSRAYDLISSLTAVNKGEADYTIDDIRALVERHTTEKNVGFHVVADTLYYAGADAIREINSLDNLDAQHYYYVRSEKASEHDGKDRQYVYHLLTYAAQTKEKITTGLFGRGVFFTDEFYDAGIPVDVAAEVINAGGGVKEAIAIHNEGIERSVSGGWL